MATDLQSPARPLVSVVIPCRNAEPWIAETLRSVLDQRDVALDVVVIDDGSTDESISAAAAVSRDVRVVWQTPQGVSAARNAGTQLSVGSYLQYLDADDVLMPGTLAARVARLEASGADVALTPWQRWHHRSPSGETDPRDEIVNRTLSDRPDVDLLTDAWWPPGAVMYRRRAVEAIGPWRRDLPVIQDARFLLDAALTGARFVHLPELGLKYRVHEDSLSRRDSGAFLDDCYRNAVDLHDRWAGTPALDAERRVALVRVYAYVARPFFVSNRARFDEVCDRIWQLEPRFRPDGPPALRALSGVVGYTAAEQIACWWRQMKRVTGAAS